MTVTLQNIQKSFGDKQVLTDINLTATSGRALGLLGRNGAGKTTTIRILMNVFGADNGDILIDGVAPNYKKLCIGYLPEERGLYPKRKIIDQLVYFTELKGMSRKKAVQSVDYWLTRLGMMEHRGKLLSTLSKGNQQKIQLITAIACDPDIVILDEPFSGLDPVNAMLLKDVVNELIANDKVVLFSSHQMNYIEEFCSDIVILHQGKVVLSGALQDIIRAYPRNKLVVSSAQNDEIAKQLVLPFTRDKEDLILTLPSASDKAAAMRQLTEHYDIDAVRVFEPSLNDIFVEYTKDSDMDDTASQEEVSA